MKRPTVFLSSTIYDFRDLRSALKHHLESQGCSVLASEFTDFQKPLDEHSYDACLKSIEQSDYFILLIGSRVGGMYDTDNRISITQMEYRTAYALHKRGRLHIMTFVRSEVWQVREDRKALSKHLRELHIKESEAKKISAYPSKFANDAAFISAFIGEVSKNSETKAAIDRGSSRPTGNWIHVFKDYSEILAAINPIILMGLPAQEASFRRALEGEITQVLGKCLLKLSNGTVISPIPSLSRIIQQYPIPYEETMERNVTIPTNKWDRFTVFLFHMTGVRFEAVILRDALSASTFFEFDVSEGIFQDTPARRALNQLYLEIESVNEANVREIRSILYENVPICRSPHLTEIEIPALKLLPIYHLCHRWGNIILLGSAIIKYLRVGSFEEPQLFPLSPVEQMDRDLMQEAITEDEVREFLRQLD